MRLVIGSVAVLVIAVLVAGTTVYVTGYAEAGASDRRTGGNVHPAGPTASIGAVPSSSPLATPSEPADTGTGPTGSVTPRATPSRPAATRTVLRYTFDSGLNGLVADMHGRMPLVAVKVAGGALTTEKHGRGLAVRFPAKCHRPDQSNCPRAILQSGPADVLNPGTGPIRYGASVRLLRRETGPGENVVQKGYSVGPYANLFKLQVDGVAGRPSCVLVGTGSPTLYALKATITVADGRWHVIQCARSGGELSITIDGKNAGRRSIPRGLSIKNYLPLRIGGKGTSVNNDQFHGAIDDVTVMLGN